MGSGGHLDNQIAPKMGLPYRRYSVPETVMRKYCLSRTQTSASDIVTAPTPSLSSLGTSQDSGTKRMSHKGCQTSPPASDSDIAQISRTIPTVNIIPDPTFSPSSVIDISKQTSNSNKLGSSEEVTEYSALESQGYQSELSLPGAVVANSSMFLSVPEIVLDPNETPKEMCDLDRDIVVSDICLSTTVNCCDNVEAFLSDNQHVVDDCLLNGLLEQTAKEKRLFLRVKSNSVPESLEPVVFNHYRPSSTDEKCFSSLSFVDKKDEILQNEDCTEIYSCEGSPTLANKCNCRGNNGECYVTDCDEGRKCCSVDDSQSCSFTSPEMATTNELKSSSEYTTSSMTLDQTVSDRTTSTQDSTASLTSVTPEISVRKHNSADINISPILVIHSESTLVDIISPKNKTKDRELFHPSGSSPSEITSNSQNSDILQFSDSFPMIISCESAVVPISEEVCKNKMGNEIKSDEQDVCVLKEPEEQCVTAGTEVSEHINLELNTYENYSENKVICDSTIESHVVGAEGTDEKAISINIGQEKVRNYSTNYMYLTEDESGINLDSLEVERESTPYSSLLKSAADFEMDSLAVNESIEEESDLLENLGFCEDLSKIKYQPSNVSSCPLKDEDGFKSGTQEMFYGNSNYELLLKENTGSITNNFMGNVMPAMNKHVKPAPMSKGIVKTASHIAPYDKDSLEGQLTVQVEDAQAFCYVDSNPEENKGTSIGSVAGGTYWELPGKDLVVPRFSALPRTLSMIVNTSSVDCSSDSDLSLPDSLEGKGDDQRKGLKLYNKYDNRLVRGDIIALLPEESELPKRSSKGSKAYFLSLSGEEHEIKVEQIPEELKQKLLSRDNEIKKISTNQYNHAKRVRVCSKRDKNHLHHNHYQNMSTTPRSSSRRSTPGPIEMSSKFTQWEEFNSSKESSDTLVPSDCSEKDKETVVMWGRSGIDASTSPNQSFLNSDLCRNIDFNLWLQKLNVSGGKHETVELNCAADKESICTEKGQNIASKNNGPSLQENKGVQCEYLPHVDSALDQEISQILIDNMENEVIEPRKFKCVEHQVPWSKDFQTQVSVQDFQLQQIDDTHNSVMNVFDSKSVQTNDVNLETLEKNVKGEDITTLTNTSLQHNEINKIQLDLTGSSNDKSPELIANIVKPIDIDDEKTLLKPTDSQLNNKSEKSAKEHENKTIFNRTTQKLNVKCIQSRRAGNLGTRFRQKFEVIPEEKSSSVEFFNDERKSPLHFRGRRASIPSEAKLGDLRHKDIKINASSTSSNCKLETAEGSQPLQEGRRHTIHGNLSSTNSKNCTGNSSFEKSEQTRRHTIHGTSLDINSKNESMLKKLNLLGGTLLKGRVFGKQSGVMFGRFRPINEDTQVQKDERLFFEEHLERLTKDTSKGREALAVAKSGEQEELLTLSKGWINFYLLRDSQDMGSDCSNDEAFQEVEDKLKNPSPVMRTVTVVSKPEEELKHQYTLQINASPEGRLPFLNSQQVKQQRTPSVSPDLSLPDITPSSSPTMSPIQPDIPHNPFPQIHTTDQSRENKCTREKSIHGRKQKVNKSEHKDTKHKIENEKNMRYLKLSTMKQEVQTEKTVFAKSGEVACSELSYSSKSSSSSVTAESPTLPSIKWPSRQLQKRTHSRHSRAPPPSNPQACWTVTLAGSSGNPAQPPPDVEMRLSFSNTRRGAVTSQSDSGLGEDGPHERGKKQALPPSVAQNNQWKVLLKETDKSSDVTKVEKQTSLQDFGYTPSTARSKKSSKRGSQEDTSRPLSIQVQEILEHNFSMHNSCVTDDEWVEGLSVTGLAITPERKPRVPTMSERDLTRHRFRISH